MQLKFKHTNTPNEQRPPQTINQKGLFIFLVEMGEKTEIKMYS